MKNTNKQKQVTRRVLDKIVSNYYHVSLLASIISCHLFDKE